MQDTLNCDAQIRKILDKLRSSIGTRKFSFTYDKIEESNQLAKALCFLMKVAHEDESRRSSLVNYTRKMTDQFFPKR